MFCPEWSLDAYRINLILLCMPHNAFRDLVLTCFSGFIFLIPVLQLSLIISSMCPIVLCNYGYADSLEHKPPPTSQHGTKTWSPSHQSCATSSTEVSSDNPSKAKMITLNFVNILEFDRVISISVFSKAGLFSYHRYSGFTVSLK